MAVCRGLGLADVVVGWRDPGAGVLAIDGRSGGPPGLAVARRRFGADEQRLDEGGCTRDGVL